MDYNLHREGKPVEAASLQELRRRRASGELDGSELVWREGMEQWQRLDSILNAPILPHAPVALPPPIPESARSSNRNGTIWTIVAIAVVLGIVGVVWFSREMIKLARTVQTDFAADSDNDGVQIAREPIAFPTNALTQADANRQSRAFRERQYLQGYQDRGIRNPDIDAQVLAFLNAWLEYRFGETNDYRVFRPSRDRIADDPRCTDPVALTILAVNTTDLVEYRGYLERAIKGFQTSKHRAYPKFYATVALANSFGVNSSRYPELESAATGHFATALSDGSFLPEDQAEIAELLVNGEANTFFKRNADALLQSVRDRGGEQFRWLQRVLEGEHHIAEAWRARGGGYANTVTDEGWRRFHEHLSRAREALTDAWKMRPGLPIAAARMVYVSLGDSDLEEMRLWFDRSTSAQLDYPEAWSNLRWGLRPRWYGSHNALRELGIAAIESKRFDTDVPRMFFDCISDIESELELGVGERIYSREDIWPWLETMYDGYISHCLTRGEDASGWRSTFAAVAFLADRQEVAKEQLEALNWKPKTANFAGWSRDLSLLPEEVAARTSSSASDVKLAEAHAASGKLNDALRIYQMLGARENLDTRVRRLAQCRAAALQFEQKLAEGGWVDFLPRDANDPLWNIQNGVVNAAGPRSVEVESGSEGHLFYSRARIGPSFTIRGEFELLRSTTGDFQAGVVFGLPNWHSSRDWLSCRLRKRHGESTALYCPAFTQRQIRRVAPIQDGKNEFEVRVQDGRATVLVNGKQVIRRGRLSTTIAVPPEEFRAGLGGFNDGMAATVIRYSNVQVQRPTAEPGEQPRSSAEQEE